MVRAGLLVLALAGCGRLAFDPVGGAGPATDADDAADGDGPPSASCAFDLCEGFETGTIDSALWTIDPMVVRDTSVAHRGAASARMHVDALALNGAAQAMLGESRTLAVSRDVWVRGWFRLSALPAGGNQLEVMGLAQSTAATAVESVFVQSDQVGFSFAGVSAGTNVVMPTAAWFCLVWHVRLAASGGAIELDGELFDGPSATGAQTDTTPPISVLRIGARFAGSQVTVAQPSLDLWVDDLIIHSAPLTCAD